MDMWTSDSGHTCVVTLVGDYDLVTQEALRATLLAACDAAASLVLLDFRHVTFIDSSGVGVIVGAHRRCDYAGKRLRLLNVNGPPLRVLTMLGLEFLMTPAPREAESDERVHELLGPA